MEEAQPCHRGPSLMGEPQPSPWRIPLCMVIKGVALEPCSFKPRSCPSLALKPLAKEPSFPWKMERVPEGVGSEL